MFMEIVPTIVQNRRKLPQKDFAPQIHIPVPDCTLLVQVSCSNCEIFMVFMLKL
jgi:hypothetical protein